MRCIAWFGGTCSECGQSYAPGDPIEPTEFDKYQHYRHSPWDDGCPDPDPDLTPGIPCANCFLVHRGECM